MPLLKFLIITICVIYLIRALARIFLPFLFKKVVNNMQEKMNNQQDAYRKYQGNSQKPEGTISVDYVPPVKPDKAPKLDNAGEFVDYEEVKEK
ncbi:MAG TPA: DUF4834 family protein [Pelobium sp.]|nr:DUF4834 family protein [Pelobium sp.]